MSNLIHNLSNADYHAHPAVSSSQLKHMLRTPAHFKASLETSKEPSDAMKLGSLVHTLLLEPHLVDYEYTVMPKFDRRTKQGKADYEAWLERNAHKSIITADQMDTATAMTDSLKQSSVAKLLKVNRTLIEASIFYTDQDTGIDCRVRPDFLITPCDSFPNGLIVDLKTTDNASPSAFKRTITNFGYHLSAAMYLDGYEAHFGTCPAYIWLVAERDAPYAVASYTPSDEMLERGKQDLDSALSMLRQCMDADDYPAYSADIATIDLPKWA
ncbi:PD-(D/E)XK nuclease-like domain-containing protein [Moraxella catarrhalis]|nr:PD-(D/E)XK nuclease-like domain-containing protein [Moraxella catarrhalis]EGE09634.1 hypothetical protein E9M_09214 [Moraxella catarrhalis 46P47B1]EGE24384.1 hypothetical protein E9Y_05732 [Moraxella catarrhalis 101P30B1]MCG6835458.1 PD-(D/E)XK nuclease-like domain-containing protein [Moraxella catarrhalis]MPW68235.1 hypothetical protein [Moraxella catarrhalis]MPX17788.1 hypothetical protein [Moraxella catarrhalis]